MLNKVMKPFNLEEYLANPSRKIVTREGKPARIICTDYYGETPIIAKIEECEYSYPFYEDGNFLSCGEPSHLDLFFATNKHEGWVNVYMNCNERNLVTLYSSKEDALEVAKANDNYVATVKIEWEE